MTGRANELEQIVPATAPIYPNHHTPIRLNKTIHEYSTSHIVTMLSEIRDVVQGNSAAIKDLQAKISTIFDQHQSHPNHQTVSPSIATPSHAHPQTVFPDRVEATKHREPGGTFRMPKRTARQRSAAATSARYWLMEEIWVSERIKVPLLITLAPPP